MTTDEILAVIANAKVRADVVPALASVLPPSDNGIDWRAVNQAIVNRWSKAARLWIFTQAWKQPQP